MMKVEINGEEREFDNSLTLTALLESLQIRPGRVVVERNREKLMKLPGVQGIQLTDEGLLIYTTDPAKLPSDVEGVPVIPQVANSQEE